MTALSVLVRGALIALAARGADAQRQPTLELDIGSGYTAVDLDAVVGAAVHDYSHRSFAGAARLFAPMNSRSIGVELGFQHLVWYQLPENGSTIERNIRSTHVSVVFRTPLGTHVDVHAGAGIHRIDGGFDFGTNAAVRYRVPVNRTISLPLGLRADAIFAPHIVVPVTATAGLSFTK